MVASRLPTRLSEAAGRGGEERAERLRELLGERRVGVGSHGGGGGGGSGSGSGGGGPET